jgi:16S rRNA (cytosine1402-N4)-methyltransferase
MAEQNKHIPVMLNQVCEMLKPALQIDGQPIYYDGTFGRGGHFKALMEQHPQMIAYVTDKDLQAVEFAQKEFADLIARNSFFIFHQSFYQYLESTKQQHDAILLDLGVSSPQLDSAERGFSFYHDGPMDMRMDQSRGLTAELILHSYSHEDLLRIFQDYGEIRRPLKVVKAIINDRNTKKFSSTKDFAEMIARIDGWKRKGFHPATLYFQALRIEVNQELNLLADSLALAIDRLKPNGRLAVLTFHSLEDRIAKNTLKGAVDKGFMVNKKVIIASDDETKTNPRSRSAKLRVFQKAGEDGSYNEDYQKSKRKFI